MNQPWIYIILLFIIFGCAGSSLLQGLFSSCREQGLLSGYTAPASHCESESESYSVVSNPMDCSLQAPPFMETSRQEILEWVAISFSRGSFRPRDGTWVSYAVGRLFTI